MKRIGLLLLSAALLLSLTACRSRTTAAVTPEPTAAPSSVPATPVPTATPTPTPTPATDEPDATDEPQPDSPTEEDPASDRKEYSDGADAELTPEADTPVVAPTDQPADAPPAPSPDANADSETGGNIEAEGGEQTATETVPAEESDDLGASEDAPVADTVLLYYQTLLNDRLNSLFECQRLFVYWETQADFTTVFKTSTAHQLISDAGAYDVSAKLLEENLGVDAEWILNKNPGMIVKVVAQDILGSGIPSTASAQAVMDALLAREGINGTDAAKSGNILLLSSELLTTQARRTAAALYLAKEMYPDLFADVDPDEALRLLTEEADGAAASGLFAYMG